VGGRADLQAPAQQRSLRVGRSTSIREREKTARRVVKKNKAAGAV
jgi:hypothetical protein